MRSILPLIVLATGLSAATYDHDPKVAEEFRSRDGLPNVFAKIRSGGTIRIAYLGGSITAANGWRVKTMAWFREQFPAATFVEINAAISGTGSDYSACRLETDVLSKQPDLVFLECRVNGHAGFPVQSVEGVVRHLWEASPHTDICFIYTIGMWMLKELQEGRVPGFGETMETVANHYGIPTIDLGIEVAKQEKEGRLIFRNATPVEGKVVFSADGVHPGDAGHSIYRDVIARSMLAMQDVAAPVAHTLVVPLSDRCWETATLLPVTQAGLSSGWAPVDVVADPVYNDDAGRTKAMLRGAVKCSRTGETITVRWRGTTVGFSDIPYGGTMVVEAFIDGKTKVTFERVQREVKHKYARFFYLPEQEPGEHTVTLTVTQLPDGVSFYAGHILIVGTLLP